MYGLALEGGGAKGAYQVGALKAIQECGFKIDTVVGTSIGAFNGAVYAQGDLDKLYDLWYNGSITLIIDLDEKELKVLDALNENGKLKPAVRDGLKEKFVKHYFNDFQVANDGSYLLPLVQDNDGTVVYARVQVGVTIQNTFYTGKKSKAKEVEVEIPNLFWEWAERLSHPLG